MGFVCSIVGNFKKDKKTLFAAVCYILSGMSTFTNLIMFNRIFFFMNETKHFEFKG